MGEFLTWQFWAAACSVSAIMITLKRVTFAGAPQLFERHWFRAFMTAQNLIWGLATAIPAGFLKGDNYSQRAVVGICAGAASHFAYQMIGKRLAAFVPADKDEPPPAESAVNGEIQTETSQAIKAPFPPSRK